MPQSGSFPELVSLSFPLRTTSTDRCFRAEAVLPRYYLSINGTTMGRGCDESAGPLWDPGQNNWCARTPCLSKSLHANASSPFNSISALVEGSWEGSVSARLKYADALPVADRDAQEAQRPTWARLEEVSPPHPFLNPKSCTRSPHPTCHEIGEVQDPMPITSQGGRDGHICKLKLILSSLVERVFD